MSEQRSRGILTVAAAVATVLVVTAVALATGAGTGAQIDDANDTKGPLDVRRVSFDPEAGPPRWTVLTFRDWTAAEIPDRGYVFVFLDAFGDERADHYAMIQSEGRSLSASLWRDPKHGRDVRLRSLSVTRDSRSSVAVQIPVGALLGGFRTSYRWWVVTTFTGRACRATCVDRVPDGEAIEQTIGSPTATATPTPTVTPTPTPTVTPTPTPTSSPKVAG